MLRALLLGAAALPASAQPLTNPAIFSRGGGFGLGGVVVGAILGGLVFAPFKSKGDNLRNRWGRPMQGQALIAAGAVAGLTVFYAVAFRL